MVTKTRKTRKVLTSRQYDELCGLVMKATAAARTNGIQGTDPGLYSAGEREAAREADYAAYEAVVKYLADLTKWDT